MLFKRCIKLTLLFGSSHAHLYLSLSLEKHLSFNLLMRLLPTKNQTIKLITKQAPQLP